MNIKEIIPMAIFVIALIVGVLAPSPFNWYARAVDSLIVLLLFIYWIYKLFTDNKELEKEDDK